MCHTAMQGDALLSEACTIYTVCETWSVTLLLMWPEGRGSTHHLARVFPAAAEPCTTKKHSCHAFCSLLSKRVSASCMHHNRMAYYCVSARVSQGRLYRCSAAGRISITYMCVCAPSNLNISTAAAAAAVQRLLHVNIALALYHYLMILHTTSRRTCMPNRVPNIRFITTTIISISHINNRSTSIRRIDVRALAQGIWVSSTTTRFRWPAPATSMPCPEVPECHPLPIDTGSRRHSPCEYFFATNLLIFCTTNLFFEFEKFS